MEMYAAVMMMNSFLSIVFYPCNFNSNVRVLCFCDDMSWKEKFADEKRLRTNSKLTIFNGLGVVIGYVGLSMSEIMKV